MINEIRSTLTIKVLQIFVGCFGEKEEEKKERNSKVWKLEERQVFRVISFNRYAFKNKFSAGTPRRCPYARLI